MTTESNKPIRTFRLRGVKVAVFENRTEQGAFYKTSLQRIYREGEEWKTTTSLGRDDLPVARLLLGWAWEFILEAESGGAVAQASVTTTTEGQGESQSGGTGVTRSPGVSRSATRRRARGATEPESEP